ncbi:MAG: FtsL-like putative cell division protein [Prevotella sp.]|jgi:hypothetical protein
MKADENHIQDEAQQAYGPSDKEARESLKATAGKRSAAKKDASQPDAAEGLSLKEVIQEQAIEGEAPQSRTLSLRKILGGDILNTAAVRRQIWLLLLIVFFLILSISNRYSCQQDIIEIDRLQSELQDAKYKALSSTSQLTEKSRESNVLKLLKNNEDSVLKMANQPPYIIYVPE